jgi:hypothetical protein
MVKNSVGTRASASSIARQRFGIGLTREVDSSVVVSIHLVDHVLELRLAGVLAERAHDSAQLLGGDLTCANVLVRVEVEQRDTMSNGEDGNSRGDRERGAKGVRDVPSPSLSYCWVSTTVVEGSGAKTYEEREGFLELGDLLLGKRIGLRCALANGMVVVSDSMCLLAMVGLIGRQGGEATIFAV